MHATMEHMTIWGLISDASLLVKAVMVTLLLASLLSWYLIIQRGSVLRRLERQLNGFVQRFRTAPDLQALYRDTVQAGEGGVAPIFIAGVQEYQHLHSHDPQVLEGDAIHQAEPALRNGLAGGIYFPHERHLDSASLTRGLRAFGGQPSGRGRQASPAVVAAPCRGTTTARRRA
mgnify:CR=1 FL=1